MTIISSCRDRDPLHYPEDMLPAGDHHLVQIVDAATADAARRSGDWLKCRPGCTQCCIGIFSITQLDAVRLREGLAGLELTDPVRAAAIRLRARQSVDRLRPDFPGNPETGELDEDDPGFADFANEEPCPVLDPATGTCDLYSARPMTCRVFGPPIRSENGIGICELCFDGATEAEILAAELHTGWTSLEDSLNAEAERTAGRTGTTTVAFALLAPPAC
ncbi:MAG TPA: YkgJ family cysteine cluster protein [Silvibacterium sp.]|nr:YkgJ family cysteine cluster protein [Silvibacterium sp.]